ncbi:MAG: hypothetical protein HOV81_26810 [Kofleriaceae bacterium]|nr:hypothetical protein [Kofleriaceae bacterium]
MPITDLIRQQEIETLVGRFAQRGYGWARRCFFGQAGIIVGTPAVPILRDGIALPWDHAVQLYWKGSHWEARLTPHGGPHWIKTASTLDELAALGEEAIASCRWRRSRMTPPGIGWKAA